MNNNINKDSNNSSADTTKDNFIIQTPSITLAKGGGAIKSIDEQFLLNIDNETSGFSIPFPFLPLRNGLMPPSMSLSYNSGSGNEIWGLGWNANIIHVASNLINQEDRIGR